MMLGLHKRLIKSIYFLVFVRVFEKVQAQPERTVMLLTGGGGQTFTNLWGQTSGFNDPDDNKSTIGVDWHELFADGDFRAIIDPTWGNITELVLVCTSQTGDILGEVGFDVRGVSDLSVVSSWFTTARLTHTYPDIQYPPNTITAVLNDGSNELLVKDSTQNKAWFSISSTGSLPSIVLARNSLSFLGTGSSSHSYLGCLPNWELTLGTLTTNAAMSPDLCMTTCGPGSDNIVALHREFNCYCATYSFPSVTNWVNHACDTPCPGDTGEMCGGASDGYYSIYDITATSNDVDSLSTTNEEYITKTASGTVTEIIINVETDLTHLTDSWLYIDKIIVTGVEFGTSNDATYFLYYVTDDADPEELYNEFANVADGSSELLHTLIVVNLRIEFETQADSASVSVFGPEATSVVMVPYMFVFAFFDTLSEQTTTTSAAATTTITTAAAASTTTTSNEIVASYPASSPWYFMYSNLSISVNGTMYCPCNVTNQTQEVNTTSNYTYDIDEVIASLTLDPKTLGSNTRKYVSADDSRPSAKTIGSIGVIILTTVIVFIVAIDSTTLVIEFTKIRKNYKYLKRQISKRSLRVYDISAVVQPDSVNPDCGQTHSLPDILQ